MRKFILLCVFLFGCVEQSHIEYGPNDRSWAMIIAKSEPDAAAYRHIVVLETLDHIYVVDNENVWKEFKVEEAAQVEFRRVYLVYRQKDKILYDYYLNKIGTIELWPSGSP